MNSKRSYYINEAKEIGKLLRNYGLTEVVNYKVPYVPFPLSKPLGKVISGMLTMSQYCPELARRCAFPQIASFPQKLFLLDRCFY